jgi:hypothetical protein
MEHNGLHDRPDLYDLVAPHAPVPRERFCVEMACGIPSRAPCFEISPYFTVMKARLARGFNYKDIRWADSHRTGRFRFRDRRRDQGGSLSQESRLRLPACLVRSDARPWRSGERIPERHAPGSG